MAANSEQPAETLTVQGPEWPPAQPASTRVLIDPLSPSTPPVPWLSSFYTSASLSSPLSSRWRWHHSLLASRPRTSLCLHHRRPPALCERGRRRQEWRVQVRPSRPQWLCNSFLTCISQGLRVTSMDDLICTTANVYHGVGRPSRGLPLLRRSLSSSLACTMSAFLTD